MIDFLLFEEEYVHKTFISGSGNYMVNFSAKNYLRRKYEWINSWISLACVHVCKEPTELLTLTDTGRPIPLWATTFPKNKNSDCIRADSALNMSLFLTALDYECELTVASDSFCLDISQK